MSRIGIKDAQRPEPDALLTQIADYVTGSETGGAEARRVARYCLMDTLGCGLAALNHAACRRVLGPVVPGAGMTGGARVPGTDYELDPVTAAFNIGAAIRWLDFNDTWLAAEWGHPSDNLGAILAVADYLARSGRARPTVGDVLTAMIKAHEIQGVLALENSFNAIGLDHVLLVRVASTAVAAQLLGAGHREIVNALSNAWLDGGALRTYRHAPNTGSRKSWAAGDATSRGVRLALLTLAGEMGYPSALTAGNWGFQDVLMEGRALVLPRPLGSYVMENVLFKVAYPAEFHAQTAVEAALRLHPLVVDRLSSISEIVIETQQPACRIIDKTGPLANPADRDHCLQYMVAVALLHGRLNADDYEDDVAADERIDRLRAAMTVSENPEFSRDYLDPEKRAIGNAVRVFFADGSSTERVVVEYPLGHRRRREEAVPLLREKFRLHAETRFSVEHAARLLELFESPGLESLPVDDFVSLWIS